MRVDDIEGGSATYRIRAILRGDNAIRYQTRRALLQACDELDGFCEPWIEFLDACDEWEKHGEFAATEAANHVAAG